MKKWTEEELIKLIKLYPHMTAKKMAKVFSCTEKQCHDKIYILRRNGSKLLKKYNHWTKADDELLKKLYKKESLTVLFNLLNHSKNSIIIRAFRLKLTIKCPNLKNYKQYIIDFNSLCKTPHFLSEISNKYNINRIFLKKKLRKCRIEHNIFVYKIKNIPGLDIIFCKDNRKNRLKAYKMIRKKYPNHFKVKQNTKIKMILGKYLKNYKFISGKYIFE